MDVQRGQCEIPVNWEDIRQVMLMVKKDNNNVIWK